jgi:hypothetical protein
MGGSSSIITGKRPTGSREKLSVVHSLLQADAFTTLVMPSVLKRTGLLSNYLSDLLLYNSMTRFPPLRLMMSSIFDQWKCIGVSCFSSTIMIFSA